MQTRFSRIAARCSRAAGSPWAFTGTLIAVLLWRWGALTPTLTIKALDAWAVAVTPERATP